MVKEVFRMMEAITKERNKKEEKRTAPLNLTFYDISYSPREILLLTQEKKNDN